MIAVFCRYEADFRSLNAIPRKMFKSIRSSDDVRGIKFTGVIKMHDWYKDGSITDAYNVLIQRQPELNESVITKDR